MRNEYTGKDALAETQRRGVFMMRSWVEKRVSEIAPLQRGFDLPTSQIEQGEFPIVYSNGIGTNHKFAMVKGPGVVTGRSGTIGST